MNNENPNVEGNTGVAPAIPEIGGESNLAPTVDPTSFQTVDPTATSAPADSTPVESAPAAPAEAATVETPTLAPTVNPVEETEVLDTNEEATTFTNTSNIKPRTDAINFDSTDGAPKTRLNPVTGEEMNVDELAGKAAPPVIEKAEETKAEEKPEVEYKPTSKANTVALIIFFIALIAFVMFLPNIQTMIQEYKEGPQVIEEIYTGTLECTLESSTVNLDRKITRSFQYDDKKLKSAKFTTVVRGDASLDEETLDGLNEQCTLIKDNVDGLEGVSVDCDYKEGKLTETETFDFATYDVEKVTAAYTEAGGILLEFTKDQDIDDVMTKMRRSGFSCFKEK